MKVLVVLWVLSPATEGSSVLYRNFVHPMLNKREKVDMIFAFFPPQTPDLTLAILTLFRLQEIDEYINQAKEKGYTAVIELGTKGVNYATNVIMQTALKVSQVSTRCARLICLFLAHTNHNQVMKAISRSPSVNHSIKLGKRDKENILFAWHFLHPSFFCMNHSGF